MDHWEWQLWAVCQWWVLCAAAVSLCVGGGSLDMASVDSFVIVGFMVT